MQSALLFLPLSTPDGVFRAGYSERGLAQLGFPPADDLAATAKPSRAVAGWHRLTTAAVRAVLAGKPLPALPPLDLAGTEFQLAVWAALRGIALGQTTTYGGLARTLRRPRATRAVGAACGANPVPLLVPCHRVLAAGGGLGGFSAGLDWKRKLLAREGARWP